MIQTNIMPGFEEYQKPFNYSKTMETLYRCDLDKGMFITLLLFLSEIHKDNDIPLGMIFCDFSKRFNVIIDPKATGKFRTLLYKDYYPQTRAGQKNKDGKEFYLYDNGIHCTIPLTYGSKNLWGIRLKKEFIEIGNKINVMELELTDHLKIFI